MEWTGTTPPGGDGKPICAWRAAYDEAARHERFIVTVEEWDEQKWISNQQMAYLHTVVFPTLAKEMFCSLFQAELTLKRACGEQWMIKKFDDWKIVLSKTILTTKQCTQWIENIWDYCSNKNIHIPPPDKDWREKGGVTG
jgi:hypothetical protein